jgi:proteasome lid subunit RPN8/RPN11
MLEVGVLIGLDGSPIFWHEPPERTAVSLPDSRKLWDVIWENRKTISGFAHSHPGSGIPCPSEEDITTFAAIEAGLGTRLNWWITSSDRMIVCRWDSVCNYINYKIEQEPIWASELRKRSESL